MSGSRQKPGVMCYIAGKFQRQASNKKTTYLHFPVTTFKMRMTPGTSARTPAASHLAKILAIKASDASIFGATPLRPRGVTVTSVAL